MPAAAPLGTGRVFPGGDLRESPEAIKRASAIILSKCDQVHFNRLELIRNRLEKTCCSIPIFFSRTVFKRIRLADGGKLLKSPFPSPVYCFCGIASPEPFVPLIEAHGMAVAGREFFRDHYPYGKSDLTRIFKNAGQAGAKLVLTTAKDFARLEKTRRKNFMRRAEIPQLGIVEISAEPDPSFWKFLVSGLTAGPAMELFFH
jgi:tetraacyldisaccharide 4'-kinase